MATSRSQQGNSRTGPMTSLATTAADVGTYSSGHISAETAKIRRPGISERGVVLMALDRKRNRKNSQGHSGS